VKIKVAITVEQMAMMETHNMLKIAGRMYALLNSPMSNLFQLDWRKGMVPVVLGIVF